MAQAYQSRCCFWRSSSSRIAWDFSTFLRLKQGQVSELIFENDAIRKGLTYIISLIKNSSLYVLSFKIQRNSCSVTHWSNLYFLSKDYCLLNKENLESYLQSYIGGPTFSSKGMSSKISCELRMAIFLASLSSTS